MHFKEFISKQRILILIVGAIIFTASLIAANTQGYASMWGELFVDLASSSVTIVLTTLIIEYLHFSEEKNKTVSATRLAQEEIVIICSQIQLRMSHFFGLNRPNSRRDKIGSPEEAREYLTSVTDLANNYLENLDFDSEESKMNTKDIDRYLDRLLNARVQLEQTFTLYQYALTYSYQEAVLALRNELQVAERLLSFIDSGDALSEVNLSLIRLVSRSIYEAVNNVLSLQTSKVN